MIFELSCKMASNKPADTQRLVSSDVKGQGGEENDLNSNLSPSKSTDPARKKTFRIISVKKGGAGSGDIAADNDADSIDGLDESQTEDLSSEFYDSSKATDLDMDIQDSINLPLTPDEVTSTTTIVVKQKPDRDSQSRFKVVKIETKEPFRRGKWVCYDFFDTAPAAVVTLEKNGSKMTEDSIIHSALSGNLSSSSSVHYVQDVNDSSSNIFVTPVVPLSPTGLDGQPILSDVFVPIQPASTSQVFNQHDGLSSDVMAPFIAQQVLMSVAGVPSSSTSFHNLAQSGHTTIVQSLPHANIFPYGQNGPPASLFLNGIGTGQTSQSVNLTTDATLSGNGRGAQTMVVTPIAGAEESSGHSQAFVIIDGMPVPHSQSQTTVRATLLGNNTVLDGGQSTSGGLSIPATIGHHSQNVTDEAILKSTGEVSDNAGPGMDDSTGSVKTLQADMDGQTPQGLEEAVETMYIGLEGHEDDADESGGSTVAIDNKIEQAMDLVKRHLMYAVREEVEILRQQIGEMMERIGQLEYENTLLRAEAKPETLNKLLLPRVAQPTQATLSGQTAAGLGASSLQQPQQTSNPQTVAQSQSLLQPSQLGSQATQPQQTQQTTSSQVSQPPST